MNVLKKIFIIAFLLSTIMTICHAQVVDIKESAEYIMGDGETKATATEKAITIARRRASERAGVYVKSYSKSDMGTLTNDEIEVVSASFMKDKEKPIVTTSLLSGGNIVLTAVVFVTIDTNEIENYVNKLLQDKNKNEELEIMKSDSENKYNQLLQNYEKLLEKLLDMEKQMKKTNDSNKPRTEPMESKSSNDDNYKKLQEDYSRLQKQLDALQKTIEATENTRKNDINNNGNEIDNFAGKKKTDIGGIQVERFVDPNTGKTLNREDWCLFYAIKYKIAHLPNWGEYHEKDTKGHHVKKSCWNWVPVELGGRGNVHVRLSKDKQYFELYTDYESKTLKRIRVKQSNQH